MIRVKFHTSKDQVLKILCLGAHADDIEIGCGGTVIRLLSEYPSAEVHWVVFSGDGIREDEAVASANRFLANANHKEIIVEHFQDGFFPYIGEEIKKYFENIKTIISPDVIFTHYNKDLHQDHRLISELTWNTYRNHLIFEYEILKYDGDFGSPNCFFHLSEEICELKTHYIIDSFESQRNKQWFTQDAFLSVLRIRGVESNSYDKYAEGFYCKKFNF